MKIYKWWDKHAVGWDGTSNGNHKCLSCSICNVVDGIQNMWDILFFHFGVDFDLAIELYDLVYDEESHLLRLHDKKNPFKVYWDAEFRNRFHFLKTTWSARPSDLATPQFAELLQPIRGTGASRHRPHSVLHWISDLPARQRLSWLPSYCWGSSFCISWSWVSF